MPKIMAPYPTVRDRIGFILVPILPVLSVLGSRAILLGLLEVRHILLHLVLAPLHNQKPTKSNVLTKSILEMVFGTRD